MNSPISLIITREYLERVRRKSFIITTLLTPIFLLLCALAPAAIMMLSEPEQQNVAIIDDSGLIAQRLHGSESVTFTDYRLPLDSLRANEDIDAIIVIDKDVIENPNNAITMFYRGAPTISTDSYVSAQMKEAIEDIRLERQDLPDIKKIMEDVKVDLKYPTIRIDKDEDTSTSSVLSYALGLIFDFMLYMFILIYGQMVMSSIIEEKNNRVLEIVVSSVNPTRLMLGKIIGIGLVAITQIMIWGILIALASGLLLPWLSSMPALSEDVEAMNAIGQLGDIGFICSLLVFMLLFFIGGYLFYSSMYAAIGSAVENAQDASQLAMLPTLPVIMGIIGSMAVIQDPDSSMGLWLSLIPFTSPMTMMSRLPFGVPMWQTATSLLILYGGFIGMIWVCAKIYRVGIFMYGKKPSFNEIIRWIRYK